MLFVKTSDLKKGMRLARPIYNKDGVLLYERNSKLTAQGIQSIEAFKLIGKRGKTACYCEQYFAALRKFG